MSIEDLEKLQSSKNNGLGVSCVQTALYYLRQSNKQSAFAVCINENDKISNYPDLKLALFDLVPEYEASLASTAKAFGWQSPRKALMAEVSRKPSNPPIEIS